MRGCTEKEAPSRLVAQAEGLDNLRKQADMPQRKPVGRPPMDPNVRFDSHVDFTGPCWLWTSATNGNGYAQFQVGGRKQKRHVGVHRFAYERHVGPIPEGWQVDHLCKVTTCVNPAHLEAVPGPVNNARSDSPTARNSRMEMCKYGLHVLAGDNLHPSYLKRGQRRCRECVRQRQREQRARLAENTSEGDL